MKETVWLLFIMPNSEIRFAS